MVRISDHQRRYTCCFCLHVRTGTILLGICQIVLHLICISLLILSALRPDMLPSSISAVDKDNGYAVMSNEKNTGRSHALSVILHLVPGISDLQDTLAAPPHQQQSEKTLAEESSTKPVPVAMEDRNSQNDNDLASFDGTPGFILDNHKQKDSTVTIKHRRRFSPYFALCLSTFSLAFCCFLVHGAVARQPTHLLPFFFLQVFDFIISLLTVVGYMSSTSDVRFWLHMKHGSMYINSTSLTFLLLSISCMFLAFKAYCLGMVWDCYKYLMLSYHRPDHGVDWSSDPFSFFPSIWGFLGSGRRSSFFRNGHRGVPEHPLFGTVGEHDRHPAQRPPASYDQSNDLPNYDDALKIPANAYAPPPYFIPGEVNKTDTQTSPSRAQCGDSGSVDNITQNSSEVNNGSVVNGNPRNADQPA